MHAREEGRRQEHRWQFSEAGACRGGALKGGDCTVGRTDLRVEHGDEGALHADEDPVVAAREPAAMEGPASKATAVQRWSPLSRVLAALRALAALRSLAFLTFAAANEVARRRSASSADTIGTRRS